MTAPKPRTRAKQTAAADIPQSREAVTAAIAEIGVHIRERSRLEAALGDEVAAIQEKYETLAKPLAERVKNLTSGVETWCAANRDALTDGGKSKTVAFPSGEVRWRVTPPKVTIRNPDAVLKALREMDLHQFIRVTAEVSKEAILGNREGVKGIAGISISQKEEFEVLPHEATLAGAAS